MPNRIKFTTNNICGKYVGQAPLKVIKNNIYSAKPNDTKITKVINQFKIIFLLSETLIDLNIISIPIIIGIIPYK